MIYASLHSDTCGGGQLFNIADNEVPCTYGELWPQLANWFGLVGRGPPGDSEARLNNLRAGELPEDTLILTPGEYVAKYRGVFTRFGHRRAVEGGVGAGSRQLDSVGYWLTFDRHLNMEKLKRTGFEENSDPIEGWVDSFRMFRKAGLIL